MRTWQMEIKEGKKLRQMIDNHICEDDSIAILDLIYEIAKKYGNRFDRPTLWELSQNWDGLTGHMMFEDFENGDFDSYYRSFESYVDDILSDLYDACDADDVFMSL